MRKLLVVSSLFFLISGCSTIKTDIKKELKQKQESDKKLSFLDKQSSPLFKYSKRPVQFILREGNEDKIVADLVIDTNTKVNYSRKRNKKEIEQKLVGAMITNNNYKKNDYFNLQLEIKNHWQNEYLTVKIERDYTLSNGKSSKHYATYAFTLGRKGELVSKVMNIPKLKE